MNDLSNIVITIDTTNAAFDPAPAAEIARILRTLAANIERVGVPRHSLPLFDSNGNKVGTIHPKH